MLRLVDFIGSSEAWGTERGAQVFGRLNQELLNVSLGTVVRLSYKGLHRSDASFQREAVVELLRKYRPRLIFVATDLDDIDIKANLELALERYQERLLAVRGRIVEVLGKPLNAELQRTLALVRSSDEVTTPRLAAAMKLETAAASSRLSMLWKLGLVRRVEGAAKSGGREFVYTAVRE